MIKTIGLVKRKQGMTQAEFANYWLTKHLETTRNISAIKGYRVNMALPEKELGLSNMIFSPRGTRWGSEWDASYEMWHENIDALKASLIGEDADRAREDDENFIDRIECFITTEHIVCVPDYY
jgi:hypothetical protein